MQTIHQKLHFIATALVMIGSLNYLSIGISNSNIVQNVLKKNAKYAFIAVGVAGSYLLLLKLVDLWNLHKDSIQVPAVISNIPSQITQELSKIV